MSVLKTAYDKILFGITRPRKNYFSMAHFHAQTDKDKAALLFKKSVRHIDLEISSYCNRVCTYCPNVFVDRRSQNLLIDEQVFTSILGALARIDYNKVIGLHRYNEPLENREYFLKRMKQVRDYIPNAKLEVYTNGDYLNRSYVEDLYKYGCRRLHATAHVNWETYSQKEGAAYLLKLVEKLGFDYTITENTESLTACEIHVGKRMVFTYQILDFMGQSDTGNALANDRGQSLDIVSDYQRTSPCLRQFEEVSIDYLGKLLPCCHIRSDVPGQEQYVIGDVGQGADLFLEWCNDHFAQWRRSMITYDLKTPPCTTCDYKTVGENEKLRRWTQRLEAEGATLSSKN